MKDRPPISFDRATGRWEGASVAERCAALAFQAGAKASFRLNIRGFSIGCRIIASMLNRREMIMLLGDDARFAFLFGDGYWSWLLDRNFVYEGEIERFLRGVADVEYCFIDGGANFGFWSVLVSSRPFGAHPAIAIEASSANIVQLTRNAEINGHRFSILHRAIGPATGGRAWVTGAKHEAFRVEAMDRAKDAKGESVDMMALDSLIDEGLVSTRRPLVVKLDVEGLEIEAAKGCKRLLEAEAIIILEDHGGDRDHTVSRYLLNDTSCRVFVFDPVSERFERLTDLLILDRIKANAWIGYNVFATRSPFWEERIRSIQ